MKIEFDTATLTTDEAKGAILLLMHLKPGAFSLTQDPRAPDGFPEPEGYAKTVTTNGPGIVATGEGPTPGPNFSIVGNAPAGTEINTTTGTVYVGGADRDSAGVPWDERIHASTKTTNKDGTWTRRRNTPDAVFDAVMAELKGVAPAAPTPPTAAPEPEETSAAAAFAPAPTPPAPPVPTPPAAVPTPTVTPTASAPAGTGFVDMMALVTQGQRDGKLPDATLQAVVQAAGAAKLGDLVRPDAAAQRANVIEQLKALLA